MGGGFVIDPQGRLNKRVEPAEIAPTLRAQCHGNEPLVCQKISSEDIETSSLHNWRWTVHSVNGVSRTVIAEHSGNEPKVALPIVNIDAIGKLNADRHSDTDILSVGGIVPTLSARDFKGPKMVAIPVLTPDRASKRQNGRRFKDDGEEMFTLTAQDRHGIGIGIGVETHKSEQEEHPGMYVRFQNGVIAWAIWYEKYQCYIAIRKLTPKECFRLQGWTDDYFDKAQFVNSDSQLYKQAGNGVTVNVVYEIGKAMAEAEVV